MLEWIKRETGDLFPCPFRRLDHRLFNAINHALKCEIRLSISWEIQSLLNIFAIDFFAPMLV